MNPRKPTNLRILEGNRGHRPLPQNEPAASALSPKAPPGMSRAAKKIWADYHIRLAESGVLTTIDGPSLAVLCENRAELNELRKGLEGMIETLAQEASKAGRVIPGNARTVFARTIEGRRIAATMASLDQRIISREREFGLTPSSRSRVEVLPGNGAMDPIERALCARVLSS